jgi:hypothetical protein
MTKTLTANQITKKIRKQFPEVEYIGGVGFCGPQWQEAQAVYEQWRKEAGW